MRRWDVLPLACALGVVVGASAARADEPSAAEKAVEAPSDAHVRYTLEGVEVLGNSKTANRVVLRYVRFHAGDVLDVDDPEIELTRYRLLVTGYFASVQLSLRKGSKRGTAVLVVEVVERNTFVVQNFWLGVAADEDRQGDTHPISAFVGVEAAETNLAGTGILLGGGVGLAEDQLALRLHFEDPSIAGTGWSASATALYNDARDVFGTGGVVVPKTSTAPKGAGDYAVVAYQRGGGTIGAGHDLSLATSLGLEYHLERIDANVPAGATEVRGGVREPIDFSIAPGWSTLSTLRGVFTYDTRDAPFLTKRGSLATATVTVGLTPLGSDYSYARFELAAAKWFTLPWKHVVKASAFAGAIAGDAPFFQKFYIGDFTDLLPDRVLDLAPDRRRPPNFFGTDIGDVRYGEYAAQVATEYRVPLYTGRRSIYAVDLFAAAGLWGVATRRQFTDPPANVTGLARLPVDLTYNIGIRVDTSVGGATIAFSNLLGLIPTHDGAAR